MIHRSSGIGRATVPLLRDLDVVDLDGRQVVAGADGAVPQVLAPWRPERSAKRYSSPWVSRPAAVIPVSSLALPAPPEGSMATRLRVKLTPRNAAGLMRLPVNHAHCQTPPSRGRGCCW
jgi:hypothetical protein